MAQSPQFKVYRAGKYIAACKHAEDAAALVSLAGGVIKYGHSLLIWNEGAEKISAGESYDGAANIMHARIRDAHTKSMLKLGWSEEKINSFFAA